MIKQERQNAKCHTFYELLWNVKGGFLSHPTLTDEAVREE
jgi:hypothetical protein